VRWLPPSGNDAFADQPQLGRRLTGAPTYIAVDAQQIHELPNGHTCSNTGFSESIPKLVRLGGSGPSRQVGPTVASADVSLTSVDAKDWTLSEIQRMAAPLKVIHASDCSTAPSLEIPLNTNFAGTLSVGGVVVGGALSWTDLPLATGYQPAFNSASLTPQYALKDGLVFFRGGVQVSSGTMASGTSNSNNVFVTSLPSAISPGSSRSARMSISTYNSGSCVLVVSGSNGNIHIRGVSDNSPSVFLDGVVYATG